MKTINEKIGYVDLEHFNLKYVIETISKTFCSKENPVNWSNEYEVKGKTNNKDKEGFQYYTFTFDLNNKKLGSIKIIFVNITDNTVSSYKFDGFIHEEDGAFYSPVDSTTDKRKNNCGYIYVSYNNLEEYITNIKRFQAELTPLIYHELRHYYDNIVGVFNGSTKELIHITLIADELNISTLAFIDKVRTENNSHDKTLKTLLYVSEPTELNAFYHTFVTDMMKYKSKHPDLSKDDILAYIKQHCNSDEPCFIYTYALAYKSFENYKHVINLLCEKDPVKLYYYIQRTLVACQPSDEKIKKINNLFEQKYLNYFTDKITDKIFGDKLSQFLNEHYLKYVYQKVAKHYLHVKGNMDKFISTLI